MKRISILLLLIAFGVAACAGDQAATESEEPTATPSPTVEPTASPTEEPTEAPAATDGGGDETALADLLPEEVNGLARTEIPGMSDMMAGVLAQQGVNAEDAEIVFASYGEAGSTDGVVVMAFRVPGLNESAMQLIGQMLSGAGAQEGVETEQVTVAGKSVLQMNIDQAGEQGVVYMYFAEGAAFTVVSQDPAGAEQLLAELP